MMPTLFEQYEKYHYPIDKEMEEDLKIREVEEAELNRDLDEIEEWRREQAEKGKEGESLEEEHRELGPEEEAAQKEKEARLERNKKIRRETIGTRKGWIDSDGRFSAYPRQASRISYTMRMATAEMDKWGKIFPDDPDIGERFPAVDPQGCFSDVDMGFKDRMEKIRAAQAVRPEAVQAYTNQVLENFQKSDTGIGALWRRVEREAEILRCDTRAAKRAMTQEDSDWFLDAARETREKSKNFDMFDKVLGVMEYAAGLTDKVPGPEERKLVEGLKIPLTKEVEAQRDAPSKAPETIHVEFADFSSKMEQKYFSSPVHWGRRSRNMPKDAPSAEAAEASMGKYAAATADRQISPLFAQAERMSRGVINRGDLIIVGGKTVREIMQERFRQGVKEGSIGRNVSQTTWYSENLNQMTGEIVSAGIMAGKRVEAFVPDRHGRIPKEPVGITKTGYEPSPLEKVTLNAWERHFARHGYYKEKAAKAVDYQQTMEARERVRFVNEAKTKVLSRGEGLKQMFFEDWVKENGPLPQSVPGSFSVYRSAFTSMAVCVMLNQGHSLEDIMNPDKLTDVRNAAAGEVIEKMTAGDKEWEAETLFHGGNTLVRELERVARNVDITDEKALYSEKGRPLFMAAGVMQDVQQEMEREFIAEEILKTAEEASPGMGKQKLLELGKAGKGLTFYLEAAEKNLTRRIHFGEVGAVEALQSMTAWEALRGMAAERRAADPEKSPLELIDPMERGKVAYAITSCPQIREFRKKAEEKMKEKPEYAAALTKKVVSGEFSRAMRVKVDVSSADPRNFKAELYMNAKQNEKKEKKAERLREVVNENLAKDARKQRDKEREAAQKEVQKAAPKSAQGKKR